MDEKIERKKSSKLEGILNFSKGMLKVFCPVIGEAELEKALRPLNMPLPKKVSVHIGFAVVRYGTLVVAGMMTYYDIAQKYIL